MTPTGKPIIDEVILKDIGDTDSDFYDVPEVSRYYEEIGDDLGRHERMAEAMYEC